MPTPRRRSRVVIAYVIFYVVFAAAAAAFATPLVMLALDIPGELSLLVLAMLCSVTTVAVMLCLLYHRASWLLLGVPAVALSTAIALEITYGVYHGWPGTGLLHVALILAIFIIEAIAFCGIYPFRIHGPGAHRVTAAILARLREFPAGAVLSGEPDILFTVAASGHQVIRAAAEDHETFSFAPLGACVARSCGLDPVPDIVSAMLVRAALLLFRRPVDLHPVPQGELEELHRQLTLAVPVEA